ncbi:hypothetical protein N7G274_000838 [Stereocaulon virgatum]|uniref:J domain-containing protein n=1 Tax=Stereocaulon virgatum TaxID=373712 RepID=A0ABR4AM57_9LECA
MEDLSKGPPTDINPYEVLELETAATSAEVKTAYKKLALRHHPDKAHPSARDTAHTRFQEIAFAYAILSDERRRKRYDTTGNTSESLDLDDDEFNWGDFFRAQWADAVTVEKLEDLKTTYQGSEEERRDVLKAYKERKGDIDYIFRHIMLSNPLDDEDRFHGYIDKAIEADEVEAYHAYTQETAKKKKARHQLAAKEAKEVEEDAKKKTKGKGGKNSGGGGGEKGLAAMIQQRQKARAGTFLDDLEAKYAGGGKKEINGKKRKHEEPPEELFHRNRGKKARSAKAVVDDDDEEEEEADNLSDFDDEDEEEEEEVVVVKPAKSKSRAKAKGKRPRQQKAKNTKVVVEDDDDESLTDGNTASDFAEADEDEFKPKKTHKRAKRGGPPKKKGGKVRG